MEVAMNKYEWLEKRTPRSVDNLRLWDGNPRLVPEENHIHIADFVSDLLSDPSEKTNFFNLIDSISTDGFIPADPVVVWQEPSNEKYYVAEGNRRVLALKLLRHPDKAPKSIRSYIRKKAFSVNRDDIEKIRVCVAPSYEDCEWYINQRHAGSSLQKSWSRLQQQRWIAGLYDKYKGDLEKVIAITKFSKGELDHTLRILQIRDLALQPAIFDNLDESEKENVKSHRIPMTILERWFFNSKLREAWGIQIESEKVVIASDKASFFNAYLHWLKYVIRRDDPDVEVKINTRTIDSNFDGILSALPAVVGKNSGNQEEISSSQNYDNATNNRESANEDGNSSSNQNIESLETENSKQKPSQSKNPDRLNLVIPECNLSTGNYKLNALFGELKRVPMERYKNCLAASLRVFLDLSVAEYIVSENIGTAMAQRYKRDLQEIMLRHRLEYIKQNRLTAKSQAHKVVEKLLNPANDFSLDTLNSYVHGSSVVHVDRRFLNRFWDFLFPLLSKLVDLKES